MPQEQGAPLRPALGSGHFALISSHTALTLLPSCPPFPPLQEQGGSSDQPRAADPALELGRVAGAMRTFFARLSDPAMLPELPKLQASGPISRLAVFFLRRYAAAAAPAPALLPLLLLHLHVCSANPCLWLLPLCAGAAAQSGGYPAGAAGAGGCVCHRRVLFLLCPLWSVCCRAAPIHKGVTEWRPACHAPPLPCLTACRSTKHVLVQAIIAVLPHPPCCSACRAERPSERLRGGRGCRVCAAHTRPSAHAAGCGVATGTQ